MDGVLQRAAVNHSADMETRNYFSHYSPEGTAPWDRVDALKGDKCLAYAGENVAGGLSETEVTQAWISSSGHRANIESTRNVRIGVGSAYRTAGEAMYFTVAFGFKPECASSERYASD